jgi:hypothetical protein
VRCARSYDNVVALRHINVKRGAAELKNYRWENRVPLYSDTKRRKYNGGEKKEELANTYRKGEKVRDIAVEIEVKWDEWTKKGSRLKEKMRKVV